MFKKPKTVPVPAAPVAAPISSQPVEQVPARARAVYEVADFTVLSRPQVEELKLSAAAEAAAGVPGCAHLVVTHDLRTGLVHHHVPCSSASEALDLAERVVAERSAGDLERAFTVSVTPLLPH